MTCAPTPTSAPTPNSVAGPILGPSHDFLRLIPHDFARRHLIVSAGTSQGAEQLWASQSTTPAALFNTGVQLRRPVTASIMPAETIAAAIDRAYAAHASNGRIADENGSVDVEGSTDVTADLKAILASADSDLLHTQGKAPVVRLVDLLLFEALQRQASDIHIQPLSDRGLVRYRLDGVLHTVRELPLALIPAVISRVKIMARLDIAEQRAPQDGRATVTLGGAAGHSGGLRRVDLRISTLPTTYGERVVLRLLDTARSPHLLRFAALGMPADVENRFKSQVARTSGIVLVTGPTGSGKTTTLYTTLAWITTTRSIGAKADDAHLGNAAPLVGGGPPISGDHGPNNAGRLPQPGVGAPNCVDDPPKVVDRSLKTWADAPKNGDGPLKVGDHPLKSVGDARASGCELNIMTIEDPVEYDLSTAGLAISQTQVNPKKNVTFATGLRHILRQDPDVIMVGEVRDEETAKIAVQASLTGHLVLSTLHTNDAASAVARLLDLSVEPFLVSSSLAAVLAQRLVRKIHAPCAGGGCDACLGTGFQGRTGVFELLVLDEAIRQEVSKRAAAPVIKAMGVANGMVDLIQAGTRLAAAGMTTAAEVARVIEGIE